MAELGKIKKTDKQFLFETKLLWKAGGTGMLQVQNSNKQIKVSLAKNMGGSGIDWCAEQLLLGSVCSSFMNTFLAFAKKMLFQIEQFECSAIGQIRLMQGRYRFTHINVYPKIVVASQALKEKTALVLTKTERQCLVAASLNAAVFYHSEIITEFKASNRNNTATNAFTV